MDKINLIGCDEKDDSSFILAVMRGLYDGRVGDLSKKTVTGRSKNDEVKEPVSPAKMCLIKDMFEERMTKSGSGSIERRKKMNKHVKMAIQNIVKIGQ